MGLLRRRLSQHLVRMLAELRRRQRRARTLAVEGNRQADHARAGRPAVIAFDQAFHGRTLLAMSLTAKVNPYKKSDGTMVKGYCRKTPAPSATK